MADLPEEQEDTRPNMWPAIYENAKRELRESGSLSDGMGWTLFGRLHILELMHESSVSENDRLREALEAARHELVTLHGLVATDLRKFAELMPPSVVQQIDTAAVVTQIDAALGHTEKG